MLVTVVILFIVCWGPKLTLDLFKRLRMEFVYYTAVFQAQVRSLFKTMMMKSIIQLLPTQSNNQFK